MTVSDEARQTERALREELEGFESPIEPDPAPDRTRLFSNPGFARMRTRWGTQEQEVITYALGQCERELMMEFSDVYGILNEFFEIVREREVDPDTGEVMTDQYGLPRWRTDPYGMWIEDWSRLTERDKEHFLYKITTRLVLWQQRASDLWGEAMFAKANWEERFAHAFINAEGSGRRPTVEDRTQEGHDGARDERYLAIFMSLRSRKAESLVRSMELLAQRLKDTSVR